MTTSSLLKSQQRNIKICITTNLLESDKGVWDFWSKLLSSTDDVLDVVAVNNFVPVKENLCVSLTNNMEAEGLVTIATLSLVICYFKTHTYTYEWFKRFATIISIIISWCVCKKRDIYLLTITPHRHLICDLIHS